MDELLKYLHSLSAGTIQDTTYLERVLSKYWDEFNGSDETEMYGSKLIGRMEEAVWSPPLLQFQIERHRGTVWGSSRADVYEWIVNIEQRTAVSNKIGHKQLYPMQARLDVNSLAEEISHLVIEHRTDERLKWYPENGRVRILIGKILPDDSAVKATLAGRRRRFRKALKKLLDEEGWVEVGVHTYAHTRIM